MFLLFWNRLIQSIRNLHGTTWKIGSLLKEEPVEQFVDPFRDLV